MRRKISSEFSVVMKKKIRILLADDHEIVRRGIRPLIESEWGWEICGEASDGNEAVALAEKFRPDVVLLDVAMPGINGVDATREIKRLLPATEVLAFTGTDSEALVHQLFAAGARGCVLKADASTQLIPAIKALLRGESFLGMHVSQIIFESYLSGGATPEQNAPCGLSPKERETVRLLAEGKSNKDVASLLNISLYTVETHRGNIFQKLNLHSTAELILYAIRKGVIS